ncbi:hypothetical protein C8R44DRAFT_739823 [Mycena epipterygia]|nr:hypothetical protein C8R44DRAFT_739823 [Mycena epipterygia]
MPAKVMILAQSGHGYYIRGTLKRLTDVMAWLKARWIRISVKQVTDQESMPLLPRRRGNALKSHDFGSQTGNPCHSCLAAEEMPAKVMILAQSGHGYYIRGTLKRLTDVMAWLKARWIRISVKQVTDQESMPLLPRRRGNALKSHDFGSQTGNPCHSCLAAEEMPAKVMILAQFDHGYYIRGTLKRLMAVLACLKAWSIRFDHGYYICGTLKRLTDVVAWLKAWWIRYCLAREEMPAKVMILAQFDHRHYIHGTLKRLMAILACLKAWWIRTRNPCHSCLAGEEMPAKVMILAQFDHGYYIRGTLKRLTVVVAWLKAWWICVSVKQVTDQKSMPLLPRWGGKVVILAQFGHRYYIRGTLK